MFLPFPSFVFAFLLATIALNNSSTHTKRTGTRADGAIQDGRVGEAGEWGWVGWGWVVLGGVEQEWVDGQQNRPVENQ